MKLEELFAAIVSATGKDAARIRETLHRGSQVVGGSRYRWDRLDLDDAHIARLLAPFPDPDPIRPFDRERCQHFVIHGPASHIAIEVDAAKRKRLFRRRSLWDEIAELTRGVTYSGYSYKERADMYRLVLDHTQQAQVRAAARLSPFSTLSRQIETAALYSIEFFVTR